MRSKITFVLIVSFLNTLLVSGGVISYGGNTFWTNPLAFTAGIFLLTFIVIAAIVSFPKGGESPQNP